MRNNFVSVLRAQIFLVIALICAACSTNTTPEPQQVDDAVIRYIDSVIAVEPDLDERQSEILENAKTTGNISEEEWKEVNSYSVDCAKKEGVDAEIRYEGTIVSLVPTSAYFSKISKDAIPEMQEVLLECSFYSIAVNSVYDYLYGEGRMEDPETDMRQVMACMQSDGTLPSDISFEEFYSDIQNPDSKYKGMESFRKCSEKNM
jgi:hypothetical protein